MEDSSILNTPLLYLKGIGPVKAKLLQEELGLKSYSDLVEYFPYRYVDRTRIYKVNELRPDMQPLVQLLVRFNNKEVLGQGRTKRLQVNASDETGSLTLVWFNFSSSFLSSLKIGQHYLAFGKIDFGFGDIPSIVHPELELRPDNSPISIQFPFQGVYSVTEKLSKNYVTSKTIFSYQKELWKNLRGKISETLPDYLLTRFSLVSREEALYCAHFPENESSVQKALFRLKFEELLAMQLITIREKSIRHLNSSGYVFQKVGKCFNSLYSSLDFELTEAQKNVIRQIRADMYSSHQMNRLLQGDVGSGKTVVALLTAMIAVDNGYQVAIMVPTEILAEQHFSSMTRMCEKAGGMVKIALLTGSSGQKERGEINSGLLSGEINLIVGTHALIEDSVQFKNLGYVVIDEQHRFGVEQRGKIWHKGSFMPHVLVMTATPIPRTLAMTIYGDLDLSVIDAKPVGRKPIKTRWLTEKDRYRVYDFIKKEIERGHQIYIVFPLIKESEKLDYKNLYEGVVELESYFPHPKYSNIVVHGQLSAQMKEYGMEQFKKGNIDMMVSTTVIEVGVDVPNATVMLIESAGRFGLSQLHQLRGRVGRSELQSYCFLMTDDDVSGQTAQRMRAMETTNDGFELSELDMKLRGFGDIDGTRQSGQKLSLKVADPVKDVSILQMATNEAEHILHFDPELKHPDNHLLQKLTENTKAHLGKFDLSTIS